MEAMFLLIAISVVFVVAIGAAFWWAIFAGQFDDGDAAAKSILNEDDAPGDRDRRPADARERLAEAGPGGPAGAKAERKESAAPSGAAERTDGPASGGEAE